MDINDCLLYKGDEFSIEWYFDRKGQSQSFDFFNDLNESDQDKFLFLIKRMGDFGRISDKTKFRNEDDKIYAFKPKPHRFLCFFQKGKKIIVTNAFTKKQDKLPSNEKLKAMLFMNDYIERTKGD